MVSAAIAAWSKIGGVLSFAPGRTYDLGPIDPPHPIFRLEGVSGGVIDGQGAELRCRTTGVGKTQMFLLRRCHGLSVRNLTARDSGAVLNVDWQGMDFIHADGSAGGQGGFVIENVTVVDACSYFTASGLGAGRTERITVLKGHAERCYYGLNFQENGDTVFAQMSLHNCRRAYYPYGVRDHEVYLAISHDGRAPSANGCILVARGLRDTQSLKISARFSGRIPWTALARLEHKHPLVDGGAIADVTIEIAVSHDVALLGAPVAFALSASDNDLRPKISPGIWRNIALRGRLGPLSGHPVNVEAISAHSASVTFLDLDTGLSRLVEAG